MRVWTAVSGGLLVVLSGCDCVGDDDADRDAAADVDAAGDGGPEEGIATGCGGHEVLELELTSYTYAGPVLLESAVVAVDCATGRTEGTTDAQGRVTFVGLDFADDPPDVTMFAEGHIVESIIGLSANGTAPPRPVRWGLSVSTGRFVPFDVQLVHSVEDSLVMVTFPSGLVVTDDDVAESFRNDETSEPFIVSGLEYVVGEQGGATLVSHVLILVEPEDGIFPVLDLGEGTTNFVRVDVPVAYDFAADGPMAALAPIEYGGFNASLGVTLREGSHVIGLSESVTDETFGATYHVAYPVLNDAEGTRIEVSLSSGLAANFSYAVAFDRPPFDFDHPIEMGEPPGLDLPPGHPIDLTTTEITLEPAPWANLHNVALFVPQRGTLWNVTFGPGATTFVLPDVPGDLTIADVIPSDEVYVWALGTEYDQDPFDAAVLAADEGPATLRTSRDDRYRGYVP
jgi:hypothetical protein